MVSPTILLCFAAINGFLAVMLGAFGAHALKARLSLESLAVWKTAVDYHFVHVLAVVGIALFLMHRPSPWLQASAVSMMLGMVLFCVSLYLLALGGPKWLGPVTPLGGLSLMVGWLLLAVAAIKLKA